MIIKEKGIVTGNVYDKYNTKNPIVKVMMAGFLKAIEKQVTSINIRNIHEVGCGEGELSIYLSRLGYNVRGTDFSSKIIQKAILNSSKNKRSVSFSISNIYDLKSDDASQLILCCEVLEHLNDPDRALSILSKIANPYLIISVPREPIWRILNICRGRYITSFGNTPGHIQHWSRKNFLRFIGNKMDIISVHSPLPWTIVLCKNKAFNIC